MFARNSGESVFPNTNEIQAIQFYVLGDEHIVRNSTVKVDNRNTHDLASGQAVPHGLVDFHMGPTDGRYLCTTCNNDKDNCPGHSGHIELNYPVKNPLFQFAGNIARWLRIFCFYCGNPILGQLPPVSIYADADLLTPYLNKAKNTLQCQVCQNVHFNILKDRTKPLNIYITPKVKAEGKKKAKKDRNMYLLSNVEIRDIFRRIPDSIVNQVQAGGQHPKNFIIQSICVPPNAIRLDVSRGPDRVHSSMFTKAIKAIVTENLALPPIIPARNQMEPIAFDEYMEKVRKLETAVYNFIKGSTVSGEQSGLVSLTESIQGKTGDLRKSILGKRTKYTIRAVISADPSIKIDEVGMPVSIAKQIFIPVTVQYWNIDRVMKYFLNGDTYPGYLRIIEKATQLQYSINNVPEDYQLQIGDIVYINIIDGDFVGFGRQPSLSYTSLSGHRVKIIHNLDRHVLTVAPSACNLYNADYDGDMMLCVVVEAIQSQVELKCMSSVSNWLTSYTGDPILGLFQDSELGMYLLTKNIVQYERWHAMQLISGSTLANKKIMFPANKQFYTGHEITSMVIPSNINLQRKPTIFNASSYMALPVEQKSVKILRGELQSGVLDHATVGQDTNGSLFHIICNTNGNNAALNTIYDLQQIANKTILYKGFTVGIKDVVISDETYRDVKESVHKLLIDADLITKRLHDGDLYAPPNTTPQDYYETEILNALNPGQDVDQKILNQIKLDENGCAQLVLAGIKGNQSNLLSINGLIGQVVIGGKRPPKNFGHQRTGPYFPRNSTDPIANGFVADSYAYGVHPESFTFVAQEARRANINIALATAVSGEQNRLAVKTLETTIVNYAYMAVKFNKIVQMRYGDFGTDPRRHEVVYLPTILMGDTALEEKYHAQISKLDKKFNNASVQSMLDAEFAQIKQDRNDLRRYGRQLEDLNVGNYIIKDTTKLPINVYSILFDHINNDNDIKDDSLDPIKAIESVRKLVEELPYVYFNDYQASIRAPVPQHITQCLLIINTLIRAHLCIANLVRENVSNLLLEKIIKSIKRSYAKSLIDYGTSVGIIAGQCISDPLVQDSLNSKKKSGTSATRANTGVVDRYKEITGAYPTSKMKNPTMLICVKEEFETNENTVRKIANTIQMLKFGQFVSQSEILYERYREPLYEPYAHEIEMINDFEKRNIGMMIPSDLTHWMIRFEINGEELIMKGLKLSTVLIALREQFPLVFIINTPENADKIILRCYLRNNAIRITNNVCTDIEHRIIELIEDMKNAILRGVNGILHAYVAHRVISKVNEVNELTQKKIFCIYTEGTNLAEVLELDDVDPMRTCTDSIMEMYEMFGVHCASQRISYEIQNIMSKANPTHSGVYGAELTRTGVPTNIERSGLRAREKDNVLLRTSFRSPAQTLVAAANEGIIDRISGASAALLIGKPPKVGSLYTDIALNTKFIRENVSSLESQLDML